MDYLNPDNDVVLNREAFIQNIAEYFFENIWQDERRQYTHENYVFQCYNKLHNEVMFGERNLLKHLAKNLILGLNKKLLN